MKSGGVWMLLVAGIAIAEPESSLGIGTGADAPTGVPRMVSSLNDTLAWPAHRTYRHKRTIETERDSAGRAVTTSVVVDKGRYLLWMQRPRVTVAAVRPDSLPAGSWPEIVLVEFQTKSPQYTSTNILTLTAEGRTPLSAPATTSRVRQRTFVTEHTLTFALPLADFLSIVHADAVMLEVGGVGVRLRGEQLEALRAFAVAVHDGASEAERP